MTIDERVAELEQKGRRHVIGMIALFCGLAVVVGFNVSIFFNKLAQTRDHLAALRQELKTGFASQEFLLVDESGARRGSLTSTGGRGVLTLLDSQGNVRIVADAGEKQPSLELLGEDGRPKASLH